MESTQTQPRNPKTEDGDQSKPAVYTDGSEGFDGRLDINLPEGHHLPHEIVLLILFFLPASSLTEFRCVCKSWLSAITNPGFITAHRKRTRLGPPTTPTFVFFQPRYDLYKKPELHFYDCGYGTYTKLFLDEYIKMNSEFSQDFNIRTVNGLLLLYSSNSIYIFNPAIKDIVKIPDSPPIQYRDKYSIGFVADPTTGAYNIVRLVMDDYHNKEVSRCDIYTQGSPGWRVAACTAPSVRLQTSDPVSLKGVLHWRIYGDLSILYFDLTADENGQFALFPVPSHISKNFTWFTKLEALEESVCLVECGGSNVITIWKLEEGGENEWSKWYSIEIQIPQLQGWGLVRVLAIYEGKLWFATKTELFSYDSKSERLVKILESKSEEENNNSRAADYLLGAVYTETMASVF